MDCDEVKFVMDTGMFCIAKFKGCSYVKFGCSRDRQ